MNATFNSFLQEFGTLYTLSPHTLELAPPFHQHPQFSLLLDTLLRQFHHHAWLHMSFCEEWQPWFFAAFLHHIAEDVSATHLHHADLLWIAADQLEFLIEHQQTLLTKVDHHAKPLVIATPPAFVTYTRHLSMLIHHPKIRLLVLDYQQLTATSLFTTLKIDELSQQDTDAILKIKRMTLEKHHHVLIPDELLDEAYHLATRYLNPDKPLENALLLLDTSAARTNADERIEQHHQFKPVLTSATLLAVLSNWTHIPATQLKHQFKLNELIAELQTSIFGQESATIQLAHELMQIQTTPATKARSLSCFLFAGSANAGKKSTARAIATALFKQTSSLFFTLALSSSITSLAQIKMRQEGSKKQYQFLTDIINKTPYAIIVFEHIERASPEILQQLEEIITTGYWFSHDGQRYNFNQSIFIFTTTLGATALLTFAKNGVANHQQKHIDLLQFLSGDHTESEKPVAAIAPQILIDAITPELAAHLPTTFYLHMPVIPFLALNAHTVEKILKIKLIQFSQQLHELHAIDLQYAPEVIRYLANEVLNRQENIAHTLNIDKTMKHLYFCVEQSILHRPQIKSQQQLFLQLNETGKLLRCDWLESLNKKNHY